MTSMLLRTLDAFDDHVEGQSPSDPIVAVGLDLTERTSALRSGVRGVFVACQVTADGADALLRGGSIVVPQTPDLPFEAHRADLYTADELYDVFDPSEPESYVDTLDARVGDHWRQRRRGDLEDPIESVCRRIHDEALYVALRARARGRSVVAVVGSHELARDSGAYRSIAELTWTLTQRGYLCLSAGGPGAAEAANLGAYLAGRRRGELLDAIEALSEAPDADHPRWLTRAYEVRDAYPSAGDGRGDSVSLPTWRHAHELPSPFATHIGKYFTSSVREEGLGTMAANGVIFAPGGVQTIREVFLHAANLHDVPDDVSKPPMVFLGDAEWTWKRPVVPMLQQLANDRPYASAIHVCDGPAEAIEVIEGPSESPA